ncbi:MAG: hypothetical protein AAFV25_23595 [Bacteroidota bacterium]
MNVNRAASNATFWDALYADSKKFEEPVIYKDFFSPPLLTEEEVKKIFFQWAKQPFYQAVLGIDMGVKGDKRDRYDQLLYKLPFQSDKSMEELYYGLFEDKRASILLQSPEQFHEPLAKRVTHFLQPMIERYGLPQFEWTTALVIGHYNYTPFGVHFDAGEGRAIHTMIGKGKKKMWFWEKEVVADIIDRHGINQLRYYCESELPKLLPHGRSHLIESNDFYFLPTQHYHIAHVDEFTIGLAIAFNRLDQGRLIANAIQYFVSQHLAESFQESTPQYEPEEVDYMDLKEAEQKIGDASWLTQNIQHEMLKRQSNQGMAAAPQLKPLGDQDVRNCTIRINSPFQIKWLLDQDKLTLYIRNRIIPLSFGDVQEETPALVSILEILNEGEELKFSAFAELLKEELEREDVVYLVKLFYSYGGILLD